MPISYAPNDWLATLNAVNNASPRPNYDAIDSGGAGGAAAGLYGMTPDDIGGRYDASYDKAVGKYDPFPGDHSKIDQLQDLYGTVGDAFDVTDTLNALQSTRRTNLLGGEQAANTAARKFQESNIPGAATGVGASMLRAQALLPFLQGDTQAAGKEREYADSAKQNALGAAADIATKLAQLEQDYTNSLASYNTSKANFGLGYAGQQSDLALKSSQANMAQEMEWRKSQAQIAESARATNLSAALRTQELNQQGAITGNNQELAAADSYLKNVKGPSGMWTTDAWGRVDSGRGAYDEYQAYLANRRSATGAIARKY